MVPPNGFACTVHHLDAKVGGTFRMSFRNFTTGKSHPTPRRTGPRFLKVWTRV